MLPLERAMSGMFHRTASGNVLLSVPSRMNIQERREFHRTHKPEWVLKSVTKYKNSAVSDALKASIKAFFLALCGKAAVAVVFGLLGGRVKFVQLLKNSVSLDTFRFAGFFSVYSGLLRGVNTYLCNSRNGVIDRWNALIAGLVASLAMFLDDPERRRIVAVYVFVRAFHVLMKELSRERIIPYVNNAETIAFGVVNMPIMYGFLLEPRILDPGYYKWILNMGNVTHDGLQRTLRDRYAAGVNEKGEYHLPFCSCQPHYHTGSCVGYCTYDWFLGLGRAAKIYAPVHILPLLVFRYNKLLKEPKHQITETAKGFMLSCMFLTTYQFNVKFSQCMLRNLRGKDDLPAATLAGLLTSLACLFERPSRVSELMLYCVPKSLEACWNFGVIHYGFQPVKYFEIPLFAIGSAILMSCLKEDFKSTYFNALRFLVTTEFQKGGEDDKKKRKTEEEIEVD